MIEEPERYITEFAKAGASIITVHAEATRHLHGVLQDIRKAGARAGVSINPATPVSAITDILGDVDLVLVMSVNPGFSGQSFIPSSLEKIRQVRSALDACASDAELEVDGGIKTANIKEAAEAGADVFVSGSGIFSSGDYKKTITEMRARVGELAI
jgi:ribulose-phosphate 3-epimerase